MTLTGGAADQMEGNGQPRKSSTRELALEVGHQTGHQAAKQIERITAIQAGWIRETNQIRQRRRSGFCASSTNHKLTMRGIGRCLLAAGRCASARVSGNVVVIRPGAIPRSGLPRSPYRSATSRRVTRKSSPQRGSRGQGQTVLNRPAIWRRATGMPSTFQAHRPQAQADAGAAGRSSSTSMQALRRKFDDQLAVVRCNSCAESRHHGIETIADHREAKPQRSAARPAPAFGAKKAIPRKVGFQRDTALSPPMMPADGHYGAAGSFSSDFRPDSKWCCSFESSSRVDQLRSQFGKLHARAFSRVFSGWPAIRLAHCASTPLIGDIDQRRNGAIPLRSRRRLIHLQLTPSHRANPGSATRPSG